MNKYQGHTPGPWQIAHDGHTLIYGKSGAPVPTHPQAFRALTPSRAQAAANVRLTADSPLLLARVERLEAFVRALLNGDTPTILDPDVHAETLALARAALAGEEWK